MVEDLLKVTRSFLAGNTMVTSAAAAAAAANVVSIYEFGTAAIIRDIVWANVALNFVTEAADPICFAMDSNKVEENSASVQLSGNVRNRGTASWTATNSAMVAGNTEETSMLAAAEVAPAARRLTEALVPTRMPAKHFATVAENGVETRMLTAEIPTARRVTEALVPTRTLAMLNRRTAEEGKKLVDLKEFGFFEPVFSNALTLRCVA